MRLVNDTNPPSVIEHRPILFYDGECGLCARSMTWCLRHDRNAVLRYAPLQGTTYAALPHAEKPTDVKTLVLSDADGLHQRSEAVLRVLRIVGGEWGAIGTLGRWVPRPVRDAAYDFVARHRLGWFGTADSCRVPTPEQRGLFLP